ncbi:MAG TPA: DUF6345 domain-containing protein [Vicinamibacterales bacterium]|nr:DUF6345 domain-containing protein [Vicinamibacterales bacterium]
MGLIGIEWVLKYHDRWTDPANTRASAEGFYNTLNGTKNFAHGDDAAKDRHFEQSGVGAPPAGSDTSVVEKVDIVYFAGHGTPLGFEFGVLQDDARAKPAEIRWGDGRLKWVAIDACKVLFHDDVTNPVIDRWGQAFRGLRYILGFGDLTSDDDTRGRVFAEYLNDGDVIGEAWRKACEETDDNGEWAYLRADGNGVSTAQDTWNDANTPNKPNPPDTIHYLHGST